MSESRNPLISVSAMDIMRSMHLSTPHIRRIAALALPILLLTLPLTAAEKQRSESEIQQSLKAVNDQIQALNRSRLKREGKLGELKLKLSKLDKQISRNTASLKKLEKQRKTLESQKGEVRETLSSQQSELKERNQQLAEQLRAYHREWQTAANQSLFQVAPLDQQLRDQVYFSHLHRARLAQIEALSSSSEDTRSRESSLSRELQALEQLKKKTLSKQKELEGNKQSRRKTLKELAKLSKKETRKLSSLKQDQKQLNGLIEKLRLLASQPDAIRMGKVPFGSLKGKLKWPAKGKVKKGSSPGVSIKAVAGQSVRSVGYGRVVFSDWMRGFGMLVIIDHGDGYMSLYGQNESLLKKQGEMVEPGTVISTSGSEDESGLYFEIRKDASPQDPRKWCSS